VQLTAQLQMLKESKQEQSQRARTEETMTQTYEAVTEALVTHTMIGKTVTQLSEQTNVHRCKRQRFKGLLLRG